MQSFRFVHAADIHLDSPLRGLAGQQGSAVERIRSATREAFEALIERTIDDQAEFLIIAGDLYDGDWRDYQTGLFFIRQMGRLREAGIPAFLIYGNHDAQSQITRRLSLPDNVTVFSAGRPETHEIPRLGVALHGQSFARRDVTENLALAYPPPKAGMLNIGVLHTGLAGEEGHSHYAPCSLEQLVQKGYDYWALGHIHQPGIRHERPYIVYSGVLQGRHIRETGPKGAFAVSVEGGVVSDVAPFQVDLVRWAVVEADAGECASVEDLADTIRNSLEQAVAAQADGRLLACRIQLSGQTDSHAVALASADRLLAEARSAAEGLGEGRAWIEQLEIDTEPRESQLEDTDAAEAFGDVGQARNDEDLLARFREDVGQFVSRLPHEVRNDSDDPLVQAAATGDYGRLVELASPYALARLMGHGG